MRYLGIDYGTSYIGLAIGDDETKLAGPFDTINEKDLNRQLEQIVQIVIDEDIDSVIVGHPLTLKGDESEQTGITIDFVDELSGRLSVPVILEDERLSSGHGKKLSKDLQGAGKYDEHALAATTILQSYLDRL